MKKKIKDLTLKEAEKFCKFESCCDCPLYTFGNGICQFEYLSIIRGRKNRLKDYLEKEVEVDNE